MARRELVLRWAPAALGLIGLSAAGVSLAGRPGRHASAPAPVVLGPRDWRTTKDAAGRLAVARGGGVADNLGRALAAMGGLESFVRPGERVAIKPNCAWDRSPEQAANTDPELVAELVRRCFAAGAREVAVVDNSCHDPERVFVRSGIGPAARAAGATVHHQGTAAVATVDLGGAVLGTWEVLRPLVEADRVINVPVVKHHGLAGGTIGMKNWMGAIVGPRPRLHQRLPQACAELALALRPTLTVVDATRVLMSGGPTGGSLDLVSAVGAIAVATDPVAADAWGGSLLGLAPRDLPHLAVAERLGLGRSDWAAVEERA